MERDRQHPSRSEKKWWWGSERLSLPSPMTTPVWFNKERPVQSDGPQLRHRRWYSQAACCNVAVVLCGEAVCTTQSTCATCPETRLRGVIWCTVGDYCQNAPDSSWLSLCLLSVFKALLLSLSTLSDAVGQMWQCGTESQEPKCQGRCEGHGLSQVSSPLEGK